MNMVGKQDISKHIVYTQIWLSALLPIIIIWAEILTINNSFLFTPNNPKPRIEK